ncbi:hypothetical protein [Rugamonas sp.]|uniref:hypothetical protein n=1 Tax=Rugamonas sp. TaxID=1926287 RepID=UPI0025FE6D3E|nr:hypothetical protein [Rugamonas sp.]
MTHIELNRLTIFINLCCVTTGILAYSSFASSSAIVNTIFASLFAMIGAFISAIYISRQFRGTPLESDGKEKHQENSLFVKILLIMPIILISIEIFSLYVLHVRPGTVSWIHIAAACAVGQNAEVLLKK